MVTMGGCASFSRALGVSQILVLASWVAAFRCTDPRSYLWKERVVAGAVDGATAAKERAVAAERDKAAAEKERAVAAAVDGATAEKERCGTTPI
jgi:hypothetical protein